MRSTIVLGTLAAAASASPALARRQYGTYKPLVTSEALQADITKEGLLEGAQTLEDFAYAYPRRTRIIGSEAHNDTVNWLKEELEALDGYYDVSLQNFFTVAMITGQINAFKVSGSNASASLFEYSASGNATAPLVVVANRGCNATDYPATVSGNIALISRGSCDFGLKSALAGTAGAAAAIIYNNAAGEFNGTLGVPPRPEGNYVATVAISQQLGTGFVQAIAGGANITATIDVTTDIQNVSTYNVLATTKGGDQNNKLALGAHTDSVLAGPGINDDGSGTVGILEVAKALSKYEIKNAVTFGFWAGEEEGLLGSTYYVEHLPANETAQIRGYLNFDMIASPNYIHAIYDGDGSAFNVSGPPGSAQFEKFLEDYFTSAGENFTATAFDGRSDYGPFLDVGIPSGGTFTGAEEIKTEAEAAAFGGEAGVALDKCYHAACDNVANLDLDAFELHGKAIAAAVATYATSWEGFPARNTTVARRSVPRARRTNESRHHRSRRSQPLKK
ncbi:Zn-dependent exopeptidase [Cucurbitaria berberidis CBS 394.84]|uniref:Peptide hydrolase n=1 Tax=Cucurbitaria berberidis CBS 394.84 TaxID=1168544 RepID=A0A9P4GFT6_9PLEO|nr:Zn-dependent exopeptidase [Cucurbitaria berberidis CBS 394.84]KAF1844681.1 Zn-dependent exopeptidase [Cucurbitaria berberidis CBS 394.84]